MAEPDLKRFLCLAVFAHSVYHFALSAKINIVHLSIFLRTVTKVCHTQIRCKLIFRNLLNLCKSIIFGFEEPLMWVKNIIFVYN